MYLGKMIVLMFYLCLSFLQPPLAEIRAAQAVKDQHAAKQRYNSALKRQQIEEEQQYLKENAHIIARKSALQTEKIRAAKVASLPPPVKVNNWRNGGLIFAFGQG